MRFFVTGGSGFIGSAVVPELLAHGHTVVALARSDASAAKLEGLGAGVVRGTLEDMDVLREAAKASDGVVHMGFIHDFSRFAEVSKIDERAIEVMGQAMEGTNNPLVIAPGLLGLASGRPATENDHPQVDASVIPRRLGSDMALTLAKRGVRTGIVRFAPTVHGEGDHGFIPQIIAVARERGVSGYIGDGSNRWPGVHRLDAAALVRLVAESAPAGTVAHAIDDTGVPAREIAEIIGKHLNLPVESIAPENAMEHFGWIGRFWAVDMTASNAITCELTGWKPVHAKLLADLDAGHYFTTPAPAHA